MELNKIDRKMPAHNNKVFVACGAQAMKTQLNETRLIQQFLWLPKVVQRAVCVMQTAQWALKKNN
jgi:hypothetical protein